MPRMTGGEALVKQLHREGVRVVFGLPGVQLYGAMAALRERYELFRQLSPEKQDRARALFRQWNQPAGNLEFVYVERNRHQP